MKIDLNKNISVFNWNKTPQKTPHQNPFLPSFRNNELKADIFQSSKEATSVENIFIKKAVEMKEAVSSTFKAIGQSAAEIFKPVVTFGEKIGKAWEQAKNINIEDINFGKIFQQDGISREVKGLMDKPVNELSGMLEKALKTAA